MFPPCGTEDEVFCSPSVTILNRAIEEKSFAVMFQWRKLN